MRPRLVTGAMIVLLSVGSAPWIEERHPLASLSLRIANHAQLPRATLQRAAQEVSIIYGAAGIATTWVEASPNSGSGNESVDIALMSEALAETQVRQDGFRHDNLGYAVRAARRAYIFSPHVRDIEIEFSRDPGEVLGLVIAHEVGHLLLPDDAHSAHGIMRTTFDLRSRQRPYFSRAEADLLLARLGRP
jgi:hypothetical protein